MENDDFSHKIMENKIKQCYSSLPSYGRIGMNCTQVSLPVFGWKLFEKQTQASRHDAVTSPIFKGPEGAWVTTLKALLEQDEYERWTLEKADTAWMQVFQSWQDRLSQQSFEEIVREPQPMDWKETLIYALSRYTLKEWQQQQKEQETQAWSGQAFKDFWFSPRVGIAQFGTVKNLRLQHTPAPVIRGARVVGQALNNPSNETIAHFHSQDSLVIENGIWQASDGQVYTVENIARMTRRWMYSSRSRRELPWNQTLLCVLTENTSATLETREQCLGSINGRLLKQFRSDAVVGWGWGYLKDAQVRDADGKRFFLNTPDDFQRLDDKQWYEPVNGQWTGNAGVIREPHLKDMVTAWRQRRGRF